MSIVVKSAAGDTVTLPNRLDDDGMTLFNQVITQGKVIGSCYGHGICGGCLFKYKPEDKDRFRDVIKPDVSLPENTKLACCSAVKPSFEDDDDLQIELTRQRYIR